MHQLQCEQGCALNFYKHHLGDYDGHTAHISWDEDMAYTRLMRAYYRREGPIPDAEKYRLARASSKSQRAAVDAVLSEFFVLDGDVWRQKRCDEEIAAYQAQRETNRRIARGRTVNEPSDESLTKHTPNQIPEPETRKKGKTALPKDFGVSERVRAWCSENGVLNADRHLEHFVGYARANGKTYADWDAALMNAIRNDWAKVGNGGSQKQAFPL